MFQLIQLINNKALIGAFTLRNKEMYLNNDQMEWPWKKVVDSGLITLSLTTESEKWKCYSLSCIQLYATPWTVAHQSPLSIKFSRQHWSGYPFSSPGALPDSDPLFLAKSL